MTHRPTFRELHLRDSPLVMANPWDVGSAVVLEALGFEALATTSSGMAFGLGLPDGGVTEHQALTHCAAIAAATSVPVSGDLEGGYGTSPEQVASVVHQAASAGLAGCSIEDHTGDPLDPMHPRTLAVERVAAAVESARGVDGDFVLTARCERLLWVDRDLDAVIATLQAYASVGADVVFAPGLETIGEIAAVCEAIDVPVSVGLEMPDKPSIAELADVGVSRVSVGAVLVRRAYGSMMRSAQELLRQGTLHSAADAIDYDRLESIFATSSTRPRRDEQPS